MPEPPRRTLLRAAAGLAAGAGLAGCNGTTGDETTEPDAETREPSPTAATGTSPTPTLTPTLTATPVPSPTPTETPSPTPTSSPTSTPQQGALARTFVRNLAAGEYESAHEALAPTAATQLSPAALHRYWLGLTAQHGAFREAGNVDRAEESGYAVARVTAVCADADQVVRCVFDDRDRIAGLQFPAEYSPPAYADESAFTEESVTVEAGDCALPGTLTRPEGTDAAPGVVLVHGSGPNDRDETIGPNEPFRDLAWGLASRGVAVLRYDKRNYACRVAPADWDVDTLVVDDAVTAFDLLGERDGVDADRRFVVGHSLGAVCTPRIADRLANVAGGAMLAASARPITDVIRDQYRHVLSVDGELSDEDEAQLASVDDDVERIENRDVDPGETVLDLPGVWWTSLLDYDQVGTARDVELPLWLAQGGRDYQVSAEDDFELWRDELSDRSDTRFDLYPDCSHLFQAGSEPSIGTEYNFHDNVAESVVADLADWIVATA